MTSIEAQIYSRILQRRWSHAARTNLASQYFLWHFPTDDLRWITRLVRVSGSFCRQIQSHCSLSCHRLKFSDSDLRGATNDFEDHQRWYLAHIARQKWPWAWIDPNLECVVDFGSPGASLFKNAIFRCLDAIIGRTAQANFGWPCLLFDARNLLRAIAHPCCCEGLAKLCVPQNYPYSSYNY